MSGTSEPARTPGSNPFVGPRPIQRGEPLHGRDAEVRELYHRLQARRILVLHSPSGAGKSSLVQAGLIPRLDADEFDVWRPIRVNLDPSSFEGVPETTNRYLLSVLVSLEDELPAERRRSPAELARLELREFLDTRPRRKQREDHTVVLLFDQFEEILSVSPLDVEAKREFFTVLGRALEPGDYWVLFIIREDYLAALAPYRELIPTHLHNSFRLDLLGLDGARAAAYNIAEQGGRDFVAADKLIRDLSVVQVQRSDGRFVVEPGLHVEPVHLQVVCHRLWDAMPAEDAFIYEGDIDAYADVSSSLGSYYAETVDHIAAGDVALARRVRDWIGAKLIIGGIRSQVRREVGASAGLDNAHIDKLLARYLVRIEQRAGADWFELSHDRLVEPVLEDNEAWQRAHLHPVQAQAKIWEDGGRGPALLLGPEAVPPACAWAAANRSLVTDSEHEFLRLSQDRHQARVRQRWARRGFVVVLTLVAIIALGFGLLARSAQHESEGRREESEIARASAEQAKGRAEDAKREAEAAQARAEAAQAEALNTQKENERSVRQMFELGLAPVVELLIEQQLEIGVIELDERWTPLLTREDRVLVAASLGASFRAVVGGHESLVGVDSRSLFLEISAEWLLADQARRKVAIVTQRGESDAWRGELEHSLVRLAHEYTILSAPTAEALAECGMLILDDRRASPWTTDERAAIEDFITRGGGVLALGHGPAWTEEMGAPIDAYPMNSAGRLLGARWVDESVGHELLEQREIPAVVRFENALAVEIDLFIRSAERTEYYTSLAAGETQERLTTIGHEWVFRTRSEGREIGVAVIEHQEQTLTIGATVARTRARSKLEPKALPDAPTPDRSPQLRVRLSSEDMRAQLKDAQKIARACGEELRTLLSEAIATVRVNPDGTVELVSVKPPAKGTPEAACIVTKLSKLSFAPSREGGEDTWTLPLY